MGQLNVPYWHTSITIRRTDGGLDVHEVKVEFLNARIETRNAAEAVHENIEKAFIIDNRIIVNMDCIGPYKIIYKLARLSGRRLAYDVVTLNSDHVSNFLMLGRVEATTKQLDVPATAILPQFPLAQISKGDLLSLEEDLNKFDRLEENN